MREFVPRSLWHRRRSSDGRQNFRPRSVRRLHIRFAPPPHDERARAKSNFGLELSQQGCFADARLASDRDDRRPARLRVIQQPHELAKLGGATHEPLDRERQMAALRGAGGGDCDSIAPLTLDLIEGAVCRREERVRIDAALRRRRDTDRDAR
jgi:hypothetical protein